MTGDKVKELELLVQKLLDTFKHARLQVESRPANEWQALNAEFKALLLKEDV